ncbi:hypothetical protein ccrud_14185 (plasmid) [Corynebacterium crudilactis]|uniref:Uncharacterized protein n=2 Tax=Corynebacterium crudilactis TaxID=1652495 RepID=A0A172QXW6_9CORY|nr:hypothetical protein ccrud_14185 [Corynebacterium crudilactis]
MFDLMNNTLEQEWDYFAKDATKDHELTIIREDGVYRHLRVATPGTNTYAWEIVTWPGHLAISGDVGDGYTFSRLYDMFDFFNPHATTNDTMPSIDFHYWAEKLGFAQRGTEKRFSPEQFLHRVREAAEAYAKEYDKNIDVEALCTQASHHTDNEYTAREWARDEDTVLSQDFYWEADFSVYDHHYVTACFAIADTIRRYNDVKKTPQENITAPATV